MWKEALISVMSALKRGGERLVPSLSEFLEARGIKAGDPIPMRLLREHFEMWYNERQEVKP